MKTSVFTTKRPISPQSRISANSYPCHLRVVNLQSAAIVRAWIKFEFIAVLISIVFGVAMTNLLSGMLRSYFKRDLSNTRLAWSLAVGIVLVANWWGFFRWSDNPEWTFPQFLFLVFWSTTHYLLAVSIYPYEFLDDDRAWSARQLMCTQTGQRGILPPQR